MVSLVACHHLVAADAVGHGVHDRPLWRGRIEAALGFFFGQCDNLGAAKIHLELAVLDEDAAPHDLAGLGDAVQCASALWEIHGGLAVAVAAFPAADVVLNGRGARYEKDPNILVGGARLIPVAPAEIVERGFGRLLERGVHALRHKGVDAAALVDFVEVWVSLARENNVALGVFDRWAVGAVEHAFDEVGSGAKIFETLLVLDTECIAAVGVADAASGDVHLTLLDDLLLGEVVFLALAKVEVEALLFDKAEDFFGFGFGHSFHLGVERALAELLFINACLEKELVGNGGIIHAHAELVEYA